MIPNLETLFTDERFWGVETASPVQRAFCRIVDGLPLNELADDPNVRWALGGEAAVSLLRHGGDAPRHVSLYGAVRVAKSDIASAVVFRCSQTIDLSLVREHELVRIPIVCLSLDLARVTLGHLLGRLHKPALRPLLMREGTDFVIVRHPTGREVEIKVVAGARWGGSLIARWNGGAVFDEKPRMLGSADGAVVNYDDAIGAIEGRLLPGAQIVDLGSPYAPWGPAYEDVQELWGNPTSNRVVMRVTGPMANPGWWTPQRCADLEAKNPRAYKTDCLGDFSDAVAAALPSDHVDAAFRDAPRHRLLADPIGIIDSSAGSGDAFTWCVAAWCVETQDQEEYEGEWVTENGLTFQILKTDLYGNPIKKKDRPPPKSFLRCWGFGALEGKFRDRFTFDQVVAHIANHFDSYGVTFATGDQYQKWPMTGAFSRSGIRYEAQNWTQASKSESLGTVRNWFRDQQVIINAGPESPKVRDELVRLQVTPTSAGGESIGARRGGHDDRAALILNLGQLEAVLGELRGSPRRKRNTILSSGG